MPRQRHETAAQIIQGGVSRRENGGHHIIPTKHELKELVATNPRAVFFYATSKFPPQRGVTLVLNELKMGQKLVVVGPDPETRRDWYANIELTARGLKVT